LFWLKPVTGDLRLDGKFELDGGEHGEILRCEPPRLLIEPRPVVDHGG
jgi:hypothetical protein